MSLLSFDDALQKLLAAARPLAETEEVDTAAAVGRTLARAQASGIVVPPLDNSAMDGYAVRLADLPAAGARLAVAQRIPAGSVGTPLAAGTAARIFTGAPVPAGADAVVMQELCEHAGEGVVQVNHVPRAGENIRRAGEDIQSGAAILAAGTRLAPQDIGLAASVGLARLPVFRRLRVAVFFTGDELSMPGEAAETRRHLQLQPLHAARAARRTRLRGARPRHRAGQPGGDARRAAHGGGGQRRHHHQRRRLGRRGGPRQGGGAGGGRTRPVEDRHQAGQAPGFRQGPRDTAFIGLPGNPVSTFVTFLMLVRPFLLACQGARVTAPRGLMMRADFDWPKPDRRREFLRVRINHDGGLDLFPNQSSGVLTSCAWADGLVDNPPAQAVARGELVRFIPFSELLY